MGRLQRLGASHGEDAAGEHVDLHARQACRLDRLAGCEQPAEKLSGASALVELALVLGRHQAPQVEDAQLLVGGAHLSQKLLVRGTIARVETVVVLVEPGKLLIGDDLDNPSAAVAVLDR